jgi:hypothetical protein
VGFGAGLDGSRKSCLHRDSNLIVQLMASHYTNYVSPDVALTVYHIQFHLSSIVLVKLITSMLELKLNDIIFGPLKLNLA